MRVQIVSFRCVLQDQYGRFISSSFNQNVSTEGSELRGLMDVLQEMRPGERRTVPLTAESAYGFYHKDLAFEVARAEIKGGSTVKVGDEVYLNGRSFRVVSANSLFLSVDGNHPLAGRDLIFDVEVTKKRPSESFH